MSRSVRHNLPAPLSSFIGRQQEIVEVKELIFSNRLVTLTGAGGSGKTRLAIEAAREALEEFVDGIWLTEFAPLAEGSLLPQAVATAVGLGEQTGVPFTQTLINHFQQQSALLIFDNCEHLIAASAELAELLLKSCPDLRILATSRESLKIPGEAVIDVPPLSLPEPQPWRSPDSAQQAMPEYEKSEAIQLFCERAAAVSLDFALTSENAAWVAEICRRLDGMPLAIELAAARVRTLPVRQIAERLNDRFHLLTSGSRTAAPRQQTLEATIDWSYALLSPAEQKVLQRLSVFSGGWTVEAAEAVCAGKDLEASGFLDMLSSLLDKSFIVKDKSGDEQRFKMLETIREYAKARLIASGEELEVKRRHAEIYLRLLQHALRTESDFYWPQEIASVKMLENELDNFRAALDWSRSHTAGNEIGLQLASALGQFWQMRGYLSEGKRWLEILLKQDADLPQSVRAGALSRLGHLCIYSGEIDQGEVFFNESLALYQRLMDKSGIAWQLVWLGWVKLAQRDFSELESLARQAFDMQKELGDLFGAAVALAPLGEMEYLLGNFEKSKTIVEESLALAREAGSAYTVGRRLTRLGQIAFRQNDPDHATTLIKEGLMSCLEGGDYSGVTMALAALANVPGKQKEHRRAAVLLGAVAALRAVAGTAMWFFDILEYEQTLTDVHAQLPEATFNSAWAEGRKMTLEQAIEYAFVSTGQESRQSAKHTYSGLSEREREVAALLAGGKSNREIAKTMTVQQKTVETYITRILNKLGFDSRVQIALWAVEKGLGSHLSENDPNR